MVSNDEGKKPMRRPRLTPVIQAGQAINFVALIGLIWTVSTGVGNIIAGQAAQLAEIKRDIVYLQADREKYIALIDASTKANTVQDQRIQSMTEAVQEIRKDNSVFVTNITNTVGSMKDDLSQIKARLSIRPAPIP